MVIIDDNIEDHMDNSHPKELFADIGDLLETIVPGNNEYQDDQTFVLDSNVNLSAKKPYVTEAEDNPVAMVIEVTIDEDSPRRSARCPKLSEKAILIKNEVQRETVMNLVNMYKWI